MSFDPQKYDDALRFAATAHGGQTVKGSDLPYVVHVTLVAAETIAAIEREGADDADLAVQCALLHDVVEDTPVTLAEVAALFGPEVAAGVDALSKREDLGRDEALADSLRRIDECRREIRMVKLADRVTNMAPPPHFWTSAKRASYRDEAQAILDLLGDASDHLAARLRGRIEAYGRYL